MLVSHAFRPRTSVRSRKAAVDSTFVSPLYRGRVSINYRVFYIAASYIFTTSFRHRFHLRSAHLAISVVARVYMHCRATRVTYTASLPELLAQFPATVMQ